jgi:hypothetical protein
MERGQTNIGDGSIDAYGLVSAADFVVERAMLVEVRTAGIAVPCRLQRRLRPPPGKAGAELLAMGQAAVAPRPPTARRASGEQGQAAWRKAPGGTKTGRRRVALRDAELQIEDGERELAEQEAIFRAKLLEGKTELEDGRKVYYDGMLDYLAGHDRWLAGYMAWQDSRDQLQQAQAELDQGKLKLEQGERTWRRQAAVGTRQGSADAARTGHHGPTPNPRRYPGQPGPGLPEAEFKRLLSLVREFSPELADYIETYYDPSDPDMLDQLRAFLDTSLAQLERTYQEGLAEYEAGLAEYEAGKQELARQKIAYEDGLAEVKAGQASLEQGKGPDRQRQSGACTWPGARLDQAKVKLDAGELDLIRGELELDEELAQGRDELEAARQELEKGAANTKRGKETRLAANRQGGGESARPSASWSRYPRNGSSRRREANPVTAVSAMTRPGSGPSPGFFPCFLPGRGPLSA